MLGELTVNLRAHLLICWSQQESQFSKDTFTTHYGSPIETERMIVKDWTCVICHLVPVFLDQKDKIKKKATGTDRQMTDINGLVPAEIRTELQITNGRTISGTSTRGLFGCHPNSKRKEMTAKDTRNS